MLIRRGGRNVRKLWGHRKSGLTRAKMYIHLLIKKSFSLRGNLWFKRARKLYYIDTLDPERPYLCRNGTVRQIQGTFRLLAQISQSATACEPKAQQHSVVTADSLSETLIHSAKWHLLDVVTIQTRYCRSFGGFFRKSGTTSVKRWLWTHRPCIYFSF